jgi:cytochrome c biogenesis protein CcmG/thiol:disulfide interchange protein DsbE
MTRSRVAVLGLAVVVVAGLGALLLRPSSSGSAANDAGRPAPLFKSADLDGRPVALADFRGHPVVLNFWASWCQPCRAEFSVLKRLKATHPDVVVLGVVFQDTDGAARSFLQQEGATWPGVRDPAGQIADAYGVHRKPGIPVSVLVGADGTIRGRPHLGPLENDADAQSFLGPALVG